MSQKEITEMFDKISLNYDRVNRIASFGIDKRWRKQLLRHLPPFPIDLLDCATGTCDQLLLLAKHPQVKRAVGLDLAEQMLAIGRKKVALSSLQDKIELVCGSATEIPSKNESYDCVTLSFGIRNVVGDCLPEIYRVLRPKGRILILEFSLPKNRLIHSFHSFYLRRVLPFIGGKISGHRSAYEYLGRTIEAFPYGKDFLKRMEKVGFTKLSAHPLTFGVATLYRGDKP